MCRKPPTSPCITAVSCPLGISRLQMVLIKEDGERSSSVYCENVRDPLHCLLTIPDTSNDQCALHHFVGWILV